MHHGLLFILCYPRACHYKCLVFLELGEVIVLLIFLELGEVIVLLVQLVEPDESPSKPFSRIRQFGFIALGF